MSLVGRNHVVEQLTAAASHPSLRDSVLPGACNRTSQWRNAHCANLGWHFESVFGVLIEHDESGDVGMWEGISELLSCPDTGWMSGDIEVQDTPAIMGNDCEATIHDRHVDCVGTCEVSAHEAWYRENIALSKYADRQWWLWGLGFLVAMIAAIFVSMVSGQLPSVDLSGFVEGSIILFTASAIMAMLMIVLQLLAFLPASIAYAYLLARTSAAMTGSNRAPTEKFRQPVFRLLLIGIPAGVVLGLVITLALPSFSWFAGIEVAWGLVFGASVALPAN